MLSIHSISLRNEYIQQEPEVVKRCIYINFHDYAAHRVWREVATGPNFQFRATSLWLSTLARLTSSSEEDVSPVTAAGPDRLYRK